MPDATGTIRVPVVNLLVQLRAGQFDPLCVYDNHKVPGILVRRKNRLMFAAQYLGVEKELNLPRDRTNVNGGAIAMGHNIAATGLRITIDLIYELKRQGLKTGIASACIGGGQGGAVCVEII